MAWQLVKHRDNFTITFITNKSGKTHYMPSLVILNIQMNNKIPMTLSGVKFWPYYNQNTEEITA